jgi:Flp pilus assembly protein TadB
VGRVISADLLLALLGGAVAGGGLLLLVASLVGWAPPDRAGPSLSDRISPGNIGRRLAVGAALGALALLVSGWLVVAIGVGLLGFFGTALFGGARQGRTEVANLEALASWTESLRDTIAGAVGLEQAIPASYHAAAPVLKPPLALLIDRLRTREPLPEALLRFGDDLDDPGADLILAALVLNARLRGPGLRDVLTALSQAAREEMDMRGRIEASRASTRRSVQIITGLTLLVIFGLRFLNPSYVEPYDSFAGQVTLGVVCVIFAAGFLWLRSLSKYDTAERFLAGRAGTAASGRAEVPS